MRITSQSWLQKTRDGGGLFHIVMTVNLVDALDRVISPKIISPILTVAEE